jgi:hypothetical protein
MKNVLTSMALCGVLLCGAVVEANADPARYDPEPATIQYILDNPEAYDGRSVRLPAPVIVHRHDLSRSGSRERVFWVTDQEATELQVRLTDDVPAVYDQVCLEGQVAVGRAGLPFLRDAQACQGDVNWMLLLFGVLGIAGVFGLMAAGPSVVASIRDRLDQPLKTVIVYGRLRVMEGLPRGDYRITARSDAPRTADGITFLVGRAQPPDQPHVYLGAPTVSRKQALLRFNNQERHVMLTNLAALEKNPTLVNGQRIGVDREVPISDGDVLQMGEVKVQFIQKE